jgi:hypothetical protein
MGHVSLLGLAVGGRGPGFGAPGPRFTAGRYDALAQADAQVGEHPSSVAHPRGPLAAAVSMTSTAPRSNGLSWVRGELAVCMT